MAIGHEYLEVILTGWAQNLWLQNNAQRITDDQSKQAVLKEFHARLFPAKGRGLTFGRKISEQAFVGYCMATAFVPGHPQILGDNKLVNAWRNSVWKNHYQQRYDFLEECLAETINTFGNKTAIKLYDAHGAASAEVVAALKEIGYKSRILGLDNVADLISRTDQNPPPKPGPHKP